MTNSELIALWLRREFQRRFKPAPFQCVTQPPTTQEITPASSKKRRSRRESVPRQLASCGTAAAYWRHMDHHEPTDQACRTAYATYERERHAPKIMARRSEREAHIERVVRASIESGVSATANQYGVSPRTVLYWRRQLGVGRSQSILRLT